MSEQKELTPKQRLFVAEFLKDLNGTQAAIRAGYSEDSARQIGSENLSKPDIADAIAEAQAARLDRVQLEGDTVLRELLKLAVSDLRKLFDEEGKLLPAKEWPDDVAMAVASIDVDETFEYMDGEKIWTGYTKKVKFWDKPKALELLGKHLKLFTDKVEHDVSDALADKLEAARKRAQKATTPTPIEGASE